MIRRNSLAATALACGTLLAALSTGAFAQTGTGTTTTPPTTQTKHADVSCGKITEITDDHITVKPDNADAKVIKIGAATRYGSRSLLAARHGMHEGDYARAAVAEAGGVARAVEWGEADFCGKAKSGDERFAGSVLSSTPNSLTFQDRANDAVTVNFTQATKFYVDGKLVQNPPAFSKGEAVRVLAHRETDNTLNALTVAVGKEKPAGDERLKGSITAFTPLSITFKDTGKDAVTVNLTAATKIYVGGKLVAALPTLTQGEQIRVLAHVEADNSLNALSVALPAK